MKFVIELIILILLEVLHRLKIRSEMQISLYKPFYEIKLNLNYFLISFANDELANMVVDIHIQYSHP